MVNKLVPTQATAEMLRAVAKCRNDEQCPCRWRVYNEDGTIRCQDCIDEAAEEYELAVEAAPAPELEMLQAFEKEMEHRCYGRDETADALAWFTAGWQAK